MPNSSQWDEFMKLVDPPKVQPPAEKAQQDAQLAALEQQTSARLEAAAQLQYQQSQQAASMTRRNAWEAPAPQWQYDAVANWFRQWLAYYDSFNAAAQQLQAGGRPAVAARLKFLKDDTTSALAIQQNMAAQAAASGQQWSKAQQQMAATTTEQIQKMTAEMQAHFDRMNQLWEQNR
jgi:hypothetical protein